MKTQWQPKKTRWTIGSLVALGWLGIAACGEAEDQGVSLDAQSTQSTAGVMPVFRTPYFFITTRAGQLWSQSSDPGDLRDYQHFVAMGARNVLYYKFSVPVVIGEFNSMGTRDVPSDVTGAEQVAKKLNELGCAWLRSRGYSVADKFFVWLVDEKTWNDKLWDFPGKETQGWATPNNIGMVLKMTTTFDASAAEMPAYFIPELLLHELGHMYNISHSTSVNDIMYPRVPSYDKGVTFGNSGLITNNTGRKLNTCP